MSETSGQRRLRMRHRGLTPSCSPVLHALFLIAFIFGFVLDSAGTGARLTQSSGNEREIKVDLLLNHGKIVDGSGSKPRVLDVGIRGDRIVFVGNAAKAGVI